MGLDRWLPANVSTYGGDIDRLFNLVYYITGAAFVLVALAMLWFLFKYRDRRDGRRATYSHGNNTLEVIWTAVPTLIFLILALMSASTWAHVKINPPPADMVVRLHAKQFNWYFTYPGPDGELGTPDDVENAENVLRVPVNRNVRLLLTAEDVIHSFFVPQLRLKQDMLPGRELVAWFEATRTGTFEIACAELCGFGHTTMKGRLIVLGDDAGEYEKFDAAAARRGWPRALQPAGLAATPTPAPPATPAPEPAGEIGAGEPVPGTPAPDVSATPAHP